MLRKAARFIAPLAIGALLVTAGCNAGSEDTSGDNGEIGELSAMTMGTGSVGGTYYPLGGAIAQMWNNNIEGLTVSTIATGASVENLTQMAAGDIQLAMSVNGTATQAVNGQGDFEETGALEGVTFLGNIYPEVMQIVATDDSGIETVADLDGKRVAIGPDGSATQGLTMAILEAAGVEPAETFPDGFGDAASKLRDGQVDAAFGILAVPDSSISEVAQNADVHLVTIDDEIRQTLAADDPTLGDMEIPAGSYEGIEEGATTVTSWAALYAPAGLDEDQVYDLVKFMYENTDEVDNAVASQISIETAIDGLVDVEYHPGAQKYYEEQGLL
ncbi:TAXI family TRAP transporter solute-binding subunit [Glycomyces buryatensis]|uniref:TAXI family TRAP transporter solute-binding subunit n=1 Tax=Glycomyces buryatensis TaxID=2570927 RepID=A0A4S8PT89_9ACTN|nr:TAXI family TRAP transporter solute-binding subunit [Glycomyces buryatensis]THV34620.1 TAXI family TRAP transporter solute-binding subunit [Glycomyces buryatensis]